MALENSKYSLPLFTTKFGIDVNCPVKSLEYFSTAHLHIILAPTFALMLSVVLFIWPKSVYICRLSFSQFLDVSIHCALRLSEVYSSMLECKQMSYGYY